jgi:hypothetical protein
VLIRKEVIQCHRPGIQADQLLAHLAESRTVYPQQGKQALSIRVPCTLRFVPAFKLGVRIGTKILQQGLVLGLELLALYGCRWLALKDRDRTKAGKRPL